MKPPPAPPPDFIIALSFCGQASPADLEILARLWDFPGVPKFHDLDQPMSTPLTIMKAIHEARQQEWKYVTVIAAPPHQNRINRDLRELLKRAGLDIRIEIDKNLNKKFAFKFWFWELAPCWWVRRWWLWSCYELFVRSLPFNFYLRMAEKATNNTSRFWIFFQKPK